MYPGKCLAASAPRRIKTFEVHAWELCPTRVAGVRCPICGAHHSIDVLSDDNLSEDPDLDEFRDWFRRYRRDELARRKARRRARKNKPPSGPKNAGPPPALPVQPAVRERGVVRALAQAHSGIIAGLLCATGGLLTATSGPRIIDEFQRLGSWEEVQFLVVLHFAFLCGLTLILAGLLLKTLKAEPGRV